MGCLEVPPAFTRFEVQGDDAIGKQIVSGSVTPIEVVRRRFGWNINKPEFLIGRHLAPRPGVPRVRPRLLQPGLVAELSGPRDRMKDPKPLASPDVVPPNYPFLVALTLGH